MAFSAVVFKVLGAGTPLYSNVYLLDPHVYKN